MSTQPQYPVHGAGLGLRRPIADKLMADPPADVDFMEVAPENWIHVGGALGEETALFYGTLSVSDSRAVTVDRRTVAAE